MACPLDSKFSLFFKRLAKKASETDIKTDIAFALYKPGMPSEVQYE